MGMWSRLVEWAEESTTGMSANPPPVKYDIQKARYTGPSARTKRAMQRYARAHDRKRYDRLMKDFQWLKKMMLKMGMNPEDARFLL